MHLNGLDVNKRLQDEPVRGSVQRIDVKKRDTSKCTSPGNHLKNCIYQHEAQSRLIFIYICHGAVYLPTHGPPVSN